MPLDGTVTRKYVPKELYVYEPPSKPKELWTIEHEDSDQLKVLKRAYELVKDRKDWCRWHFAVDASGAPVRAKNRHAVRFCAAGGLYRAENEMRLPVGTAYEAYPAGLILVNTYFGHRAALAYLAYAIRRAS